MGQSCGSDAAGLGSAIARAPGPVGFLSLVLCLSVAACGSVAPSGSPSTTTSASAVATSAAPATPPGPPATADDWPFFRGDAARTGEGGSGPQGQPVLQWRYQAGGSVSGAVVIVGGLVYTSSDDNVLHALDLTTGID